MMTRKVKPQMGRGGRPSAVAFAAMCACAVASAQEAPVLWNTAQLAAAGYTAAINTPTADVLPWGAAVLGWNLGNPEKRRLAKSGPAGSVNFGLGLLPGLEAVGRLAYDGDINCNTFSLGCDARQRDLSVSGKYQLPIELPWDTRLAVGVTDYGGAATNYRQVYGVATSTWGPLDLSLGYSRPSSRSALMDGVFGSAVMRINERWAAALENDTRHWRAGMHYTQPLTDTLSVQAGMSRVLGQAGQLPTWQANVALNVMLGQGGRPAVVPARSALTKTADSVPPSEPMVGQVQMSNRNVVDAGAAATQVAPLTAEALAADLVANGFSQVTVKYWPAQLGESAIWLVRAEPRRWRQSQADAVGVALGRWLKLQAGQAQKRQDELLLTLTYQREPVMHLRTSGACLDSWLGGWARCELSGDEGAGRALRFSQGPTLPQTWLAAVQSVPPAQDASQEGMANWMPQIEIGPNLRTAVGTEFGLFDYSLALDIGVEVGLAPGLFWQGVYSTSVAHSSDFAIGGAYADRRHPGAGMDTSLLTYWRPLPGGLAAQAVAGRLTRHETGGQLDGLWLSGDGRWRLSGMVGRYESDQDARVRKPVLGALRYSVVPGAWQLEGMTGRFMGGDEGFKLMSHHWLGDVKFSMYYRRSATPEQILMPSRQFLGFEVSIPLGPKAATQIGPVSVRGSDRWNWGLETKVGEGDNVITGGYGVVPRLRHGLTTDVTDHDRSGVDEWQAQLPRIRSWLQRLK